MKDVGARAMALQAQQAVQTLREEQSQFMGQVLEQMASALTPVATQAAKAVQDAARVGAQVQHIHESLQVLELEGNTHRVDLNAIRESLAHQTKTLTALLVSLKRLTATFYIPELDNVPEPKPAGNRETRRRIEREQRHEH